MLNPIGTQIIETERFILRPFYFQDAYSMYYFYLSREKVCRYLEFEPYQNINEVYNMLQIYIKRYSNPYYFHWAIVDKMSGYVIGSTSIHNINFNDSSCEIGICLSDLYWRRGIGKEVLNKVINYALNKVEITKIYAFYMSENIGSAKLLESLGGKRCFEKDSYIIKRNQRTALNCVKLN